MQPDTSVEHVRGLLAGMRSRDLPTRGGRTLAYVYDSGLEEVDALAAEVVAAFAGTNGLDPTAFPSLAAMESELVAVAAELLDAPAGRAGSVTSGGTESCLLAVLAARDARPDVAEPELVVASTAHAAFHKAAHLFGLRTVLVDVDPVTFRADAGAMAAALTDRTVLVVVSAPSYAHGVVDPVEQVAAAAAARGVRCHVDACIGGWVLPFLDGTPPWTFSVEGVTSISVDLHKYAYAPKGASLLLHRSAALRRSQLFAWADWPGYTVVNPTLQSTRPGGPLAGAWATVRAIGTDGYRDLAQRARATTLAVAQAASSTDGLHVVAAPDSTLLALGADGSLDVFTLADEMAVLGWFVQPQLRFGAMAPTLHLSVSASTPGEELARDLAAATAAARALGPVHVDPGVAALVAGLDPATLDEAALGGLLAAAGLGGADGGLALPERMAPVNALLDACPAPVRAALVGAVVDLLSR
jgi:glutamate/tyrosine decarboxylase-like PLP-dependent enzyme